MIIFLKKREVNQKKNTRNLEAHQWILKDLLKVDQSQILSVLLQGLDDYIFSK